MLKQFDFFSISKYFNLSVIFEKKSILVKIFEKLQFNPNLRKISISAKFSKNFDFGWNFRNISMFFQNFEKTLIKQNFRIFEKKSILVKIFEKLQFNPNLRKISISAKFSKNFDFRQISQKFRFW